jgi:WD40 repeat protein
MKKQISFLCIFFASLLASCGVNTRTEETHLLGGAVITSESASEIKLLGVLEGHKDKITSVVFSNDGYYIATTSRDRTTKLWDAQTWQELYQFDTGTSELDINGITFSPDSHFLITPQMIWDVATHEMVTTLNRSGLHVAVSPDGTLLAINAFHQPIRLWNVTSGEILRDMAGSADDVIFSLAFSPDGKWLADSCRFGIVHIWDVASGDLVKTLEYGDNSNVHDLAFTPDGTQMATGGTAHSMRLWDVNSGQTIKSFSQEGVMGLAFSPDGAILAAVASYFVKIWDVKSGSLLANLRLDSESMTVAFSADGSLIAAGAYDGNVYLWGIRR